MVFFKAAFSTLHHTFRGASSEAQQRGALATSQIVTGLMDGLEATHGSEVFVADLLGNRLA